MTDDGETPVLLANIDDIDDKEAEDAAVVDCDTEMMLSECAEAEELDEPGVKTEDSIDDSETAEDSDEDKDEYSEAPEL